MVAVGDSAPDFALRDEDGTVRRLAEWRGAWLVLYFYPKDETPGCVAEACAFRDNWGRVEDAGVTVVGVSRDSVKSHAAFVKNRRLPFTLLADPQGLVVDAFDAKGFLGWTKRLTFLIDPQGVIRFVHDSRLKPTSHVDAVLEALETEKAKDAARAESADAR